MVTVSLIGKVRTAGITGCYVQAQEMSLAIGMDSPPIDLEAQVSAMT